MSAAGYPYDNSPMERYFNKLKNEMINLHYYHDDEELNTAIEDFAYNHVRPYAFNSYKTILAELTYSEIFTSYYKKMSPCLYLCKSFYKFLSLLP
jgi:transposase InsO family protein